MATGDGWLVAAAPDSLPVLADLHPGQLRAAAAHFASLRERVLANPHHEPQVEPARRPLARAAAVLIGFQQQDDGALALVLTERQAGLRFAGHIAFPGGHCDRDDRDATATALREAEEEIGLSHRHVDVLGELPPYYSHAGHRIVGVLALVDEGAGIRANPQEVARVLRLPARALFDPRAYRLVRRSTQPYRANYQWRAPAVHSPPRTGGDHPASRGPTRHGTGSTVGGPTLSLLIHLYSALAHVTPR